MTDAEYCKTLSVYQMAAMLRFLRANDQLPAARVLLHAELKLRQRKN